MKKSIFLILTLVLSCLLFASLGIGTTVHTSPSPADGATGVHTEIGIFSLQLNSTTPTDICVNISLYQGTTNITDVYLTGKSNGSQSLTLPSLDGSTLYRVEIESNDTSGFTYGNYTFTTGTKRLTDQTDTFNAGEILVLGLILTVIILGFMAWFVQDFRNNSFSIDKLVQKLILLFIFSAIVVVIASII